MREIKCKFTYSEINMKDGPKRIMTGCTATERDGTRRYVAPLYYGQMIREYAGRYFYKKEVPENYFEKAAVLEKAGWYQWYHYDNWVNENTKNKEYCGWTTDEAIKMLDKGYRAE
jgi:hypothetical protein